MDFGVIFLYLVFILIVVMLIIFFTHKIRDTYKDRIAVATTYPHPTWPEPEETSESSEESSDIIQ